MVDRFSVRVLQLLREQWDNFKVDMERMNRSAQVRPAGGQEVFRVTKAANGIAEFQLAPVVFRLPEKAQHVSANLFVVVEGELVFRREDFCENEPLVTREFRTRVAYFRLTPAALTHVYGAHYDFSLGWAGHPVFHGQLRNFLERSERIKTLYSIDHALRDCMKGLLQAVRIPTAQMDVFSVFVQLCADHLLCSSSGPEERDAFGSLLKKNAFCKGAASQAPQLVTVEASTCYRAVHWYSSRP